MTFYKDVEEKIAAQLEDGSVTVDLAESLEEEHSVRLDSEVGIELQTPLWENIFIPGMMMKTRGVKVPDFAKCCDDGNGSAGIYTYAFQRNQEEDLFGAVVISRKWIRTTAIIPVVFWTPSGTGSSGQKVAWGIEYLMPSLNDRLVGNSTVISAADHTPSSDTTLTAGTVYSTQLPSITPPANPFSCLEYRIFRDADHTDDTYTQDALLGAFGLFIQVNRIGCSATEAFNT